MNDDLCGLKIGRLLVIEKVEVKNKNSMYKCDCDCGNTVVVSRPNLRNNHTKSCGCLSKETTSTRSSTHKMSKTKLYSVWNAMTNRCKKCNGYADRNITVCKEWEKSDNFLNWAISNGYREGLTIDRINNDGNYEPNNCRWVDMIVQNNNKRKFWRHERNIDKGVSFDKTRNKYIGQITINRKLYSKRFSILEDAKLWRISMINKAVNQHRR